VINKKTLIYYPVFLNLKNKKVIVCGGGHVAERKICALLKAGAEVMVVSPEITKRLETIRAQRRLKHICRKYRKSDLKDAFLVIAATDNLSVNERISHDAPCLVNVVDAPDFCNFIVPSTINRGPLKLAISTSGVSPALAKTIRRELEGLYGAEFSEFLKFLQNTRAKAMKLIPDRKKRRQFLKDIGSGKMVGILRDKGTREAKRVIAISLNKYIRAEYN
jgi:precorrin-2 dehydrogenase/sirohydrochlorin ferrochelatase